MHVITLVVNCHRESNPPTSPSPPFWGSHPRSPTPSTYW
jgi:hypothetical protein